MNKSFFKKINDWVEFRISNLTDPMPLKESIKNYNDYWKEREREGKLPSTLRRFEILNNYIESNNSLLDIGCGDGSFLNFLKNKNKSLNLFGLDISEHAVHSTQMKGIKAQVCDVMIEDFYLEDEYDYICLSEFIEHIAHPELLIKKIKNKFKKYLFITIPNLGYIENRFRLAIVGKMPLTNVFYHIKEHIRFWTVKDFLYWANHLGLTVEAYHGQYGLGIPGIRLWKYFPSLFASGIIYILKRK